MMSDQPTRPHSSGIDLDSYEQRIALIHRLHRERDEIAGELAAARSSMPEFIESVRRETSIIGRLRAKIRRAS